MRNLKKKYIHITTVALLIIFAASNFAITPNNLVASTPTPTPTPTPVPAAGIPQMSIKEALGFANVTNHRSGVQPNDFFILIRYELNIGTAPNTQWCKSPEYLENDSGCELTNPNPEFPFSLKEGRVYVEYQECNGSPASCTGTGIMHLQNAKIPRIGKGLMGIYGEAPAASTFGFNPSLVPGKVCLKYNSDYFDPAANGSWLCQQVQNMNSLTTPGGNVLAAEISGSSGILYNLETDLGLPENTLVTTQGLVSTVGEVFLQEALPGIKRVAVDVFGESVFEIGFERPNSSTGAVGVDSGLQNKIVANATAKGTTNDLNIISAQYLGFDSGGYAATIIFIILGLFAGGAVFIATQNAFFSFSALVMMILPGLYIQGVSVAFLFTAISIGIVFGSWYWIRRSPE